MNYIITEDKTKLYVKDWGSGQPVILMHGWHYFNKRLAFLRV